MNTKNITSKLALLGVLALGATGCSDRSTGPVVIKDIEQEAIIVQPVNDFTLLYRVPFVLNTENYKVGDTINPDYFTKGKQELKGGQ
jgi:hypothetical protein